jgi:hypothetical protein
MALLAGRQNVIRVFLPPVELREDLDFVEAGIAGGFDPRPDPRQIDDSREGSGFFT